MKISKKIINQFNATDALLVISSFPSEGGEVAADNAISRYTKLLLTAFPKHRKLVVICEKREKTHPYVLDNNILVIPTYTFGNPFLFVQMEKIIRQFDRISSINLQFEFSIYGGKITLFPLILYLMSLRARGKFVTCALHQVCNDLNELSAHLGIKKNGVKVFVLNKFLSVFYKTLNLSCNRFIVHDNFLRERLLKHTTLSKISVIAHGGEPYGKISRKFRLESRRKYGFNDREFVVLAFGYRSAYKGTDFIVSSISKISYDHPDLKIKLLLAGGESPTLKGTLSYYNFTNRLNKLISSNRRFVKALGFVPEQEVAAIFAASDLVVFPYRARMSASGALSLAFQYGKPVLVSKKFVSNFDESDILNSMNNYSVSYEDIVFSLMQKSLEKRLIGAIKNKLLLKKVSDATSEVSVGRSWENMALKYDFVCMGPSLDGTTLYSPEFVRE